MPTDAPSPPTRAAVRGADGVGVELRRLSRLVRPWILGSTLLQFAASLAEIGAAFFLAHALSGVFPEPVDTRVIWDALLGFALLVLARLALNAAAESLSSRASNRVRQDWRARLVVRCGSLAPGTGPAPGEFPALAGEGVDALDPWATRYLPQRLLAGLIPLAVLAAVALRDPWSALVLAITGPLIPVFMVLIGRLTREQASRQAAALLALSGHFAAMLRGLFTLKLLGRAAGARESVAGKNREWTLETLALLRTVFLSALVLEWLATLSTAVVAVEAGMRLLYGKMAFEPALFTILLAPIFFAPLRALGLRHHALQDARAAVEKLLSFQSTSESPHDRCKSQAEHPASTPGPVGSGTEGASRANGGETHERSGIAFPIRISGLSFRWNDQGARLFDSLSLELNRGECVGLTGPSGAGKSTLARLLLRLPTPGGTIEQGRFECEGEDLAQMGIDSWHRHLAWLSQHTHLFHGSIRDNLLLAAPNADEARLWEALTSAGLAPSVRRFPDGLGTPVGEDGARLSGGERQRLALARALLKEAPLWVLDEFTAHLDPDLENAVLEKMAAWRAGRTLLVISHRQAPLALCDRVLVLEGGRLRASNGRRAPHGGGPA